MSNDFITNLTLRGLIQDKSHGIEGQLQKEKTLGYIGFDLTAESLHVGNLIPIILLKHLQNAGHRPVVILGGATSVIGDPTFKAEERKLLSDDEIFKNQIGIQRQLEKFLDFTDKSSGAMLLNNIDWLGNANVLTFLRDTGKHITVNYMMAKDSVKARLETGISFTEFSYQLLQAYDFYYLNKNYNVKLQMGGADQWGNLTTGAELIRKKNGNEVYMLTAPLVLKPDGTKFGKSEKGNVWLDSRLTSVYDFYQFWLNITDAEAEKFIKFYSFKDIEQLQELIEKHHLAPEKRILQKCLAEEITQFVHSKSEFYLALRTSEYLFGLEGSNEDICEEILEEISKNIETICIARSDFETILDICDLLSSKTNFKIFTSKSEARRLIDSGGVYLNKAKVNNASAKELFHLLYDKYILVQKGKRFHYMIKIV